MFLTSMNQFLLITLIYSDDMYILQKKNGKKCSILREIRAQTFYYPLYGEATAYSTNENPSPFHFDCLLCLIKTLQNMTFGIGMLGLYEVSRVLLS